jgi:hypothetical protein
MTKLYTTEIVLLPRTKRGVEEFEESESGGQDAEREA